MRKSTIFISAVLTTFALVMLFRVVSAYNTSKNAAQVAASAPTATIPAPTATDPPAAVPTNAALSPTDAAQLAAKVMGNPNLLSAEDSNYNGVNAYLITFTNNDVVYVGLDGQILSVQKAPVAPIMANAAPSVQHTFGGNVGHSSGESHSSGGESEGHDD